MRDLPPNMTDYLVTRESFRLDVPARYNYARDVVDAWAATEPGKLALLAVGPDGGHQRRYSFADLAASSNRAANFLAAQGVGKGDRVFAMLPRIPDWYDVILGCIKLGAIPLPGTTLLTSRDIAYRVERAEATIAITDAAGVPRVDEAAERFPLLSTRIQVDDQVEGQAGALAAPGWRSWRAGLAAASASPPVVEPTSSDDPMLIYFTSGTVAHASVGSSHLCTMTLAFANAPCPSVEPHHAS
jgi:acyl-coenzyme A synthetase/AMP-(fatty) acid ligase